MLGIGFLALLGVGMAVSMGSGDDGVEIEQDNDTQDDVVNPHQGEQDLLDFGDFGFEPSDELSTDDLQRINEFIADLQENPTDDAPALFQQFLDALEAEKLGDAGDDGQPSEKDGEGPQTPDVGGGEDVVDEDTAEDVVRPPMGDEFRDPLKIAEDEDAPQSAQDLVTVTGSAGEVDDALILSSSPAGTDTDFVVTAPEGPNSINIEYDTNTTFEIQYNEATTSVVAGLNSDIEGPAGLLNSETTTALMVDGDEVNQVTLTKRFESATEIRIEVANEDIGQNVARIELTNPLDTLDFDFEAPSVGGYHLVYLEEEEQSDGDSAVSKRAFVVYSATTAPTEAEVAALGDLNDTNSPYKLVAEIFLGDDAVLLQRDDSTGKVTEIVVEDFINDDPAISSSVGWASVSHHDEDTVDPAMLDGDGDAGDDFGDPFEQLDLPFNIPFF